MIRNQADLELTKSQLALVEDALYSLRQEILPKSEARYALMAEGYLDEIQKLQAEINEFLAKSRASS